MADTSDPEKKKDANEPPAWVPAPKPKVSGCTLALAISILIVVVFFGILVGACWR
jgi:hypothetical protein